MSFLSGWTEQRQAPLTCGESNFFSLSLEECFTFIFSLFWRVHRLPCPFCVASLLNWIKRKGHPKTLLKWHNPSEYSPQYLQNGFPDGPWPDVGWVSSHSQSQCGHTVSALTRNLEMAPPAHVSCAGVRCGRSMAHTRRQNAYGGRTQTYLPGNHPRLLRIKKFKSKVH